MERSVSWQGTELLGLVGQGSTIVSDIPAWIRSINLVLWARNSAYQDAILCCCSFQSKPSQAHHRVFSIIFHSRLKTCLSLMIFFFKLSEVFYPVLHQSRMASLHFYFGPNISSDVSVVIGGILLRQRYSLYWALGCFQYVGKKWQWMSVYMSCNKVLCVTNLCLLYASRVRLSFNTFKSGFVIVLCINFNP